MPIISKNTHTDVAERLRLLKKIKKVIKASEPQICEALHKDLGKPEFESLVTETRFILAELNYIISNLKEWTRPEKVPASFINFPAKEYILKQPYGRVLIFSPWNYPFQLAMSPLIGAIAAGNSVVLKPSEYAVNTNVVIKDILNKVFDIRYVTMIEGGPILAEELLKQPWDYIFYTGNTTVGKKVYEAAAKNLTPVTLELGGKNPCIVDETADIKLAAKRITWGKFLNTGQTCVAPDFIIVHESKQEQLTHALREQIKAMYGNTIAQNKDYGRIIHKKHFNRLKTALEEVSKHIVFGGSTDEQSLFIEPTIVSSPPLHTMLMSEEIFGPILPIITYKYEKDLDELLEKYRNPLAFYVFSDDKHFANALMNNYSFGGGCINDTLVQVANKELPFGGIGNSGIGNYHAKASFNTFSHQKSVVKRGKLDPAIRYAPYKGKIKLLKLLSRFM